ncbi:MAG: hypothetical protein HYV07_11870 [Deltaproteobacteria bacterium]|nr:hypothetical protein [Deltaproteobacteria bacterium]
MSLSSIRAWISGVEARRRDVVGINQRNVELIYRFNDRRDYPLADDKLLAKERFASHGVPTPETLAVCDGLFAIRGVVDRLSAYESFAIKPANGGGGEGILVLGERVRAGPGEVAWRRAGGAVVNAADLERHFADIVFGTYSNQLEDRAFVERRIVPHSFFTELWSDGLCDVRVITLESRPVMSMVRVPTHRSLGRANLHQGGIGLAVELGTGRTFRAVSMGKTLTHHPESGAALLGLDVPSFGEVLAVAGRAADAVPLKYLGVDVVVDRDRGPLILEINARPGLEIQNVNGVGLGPSVRRALGDLG